MPRRSALAHLPKHLQIAIVSYRRQADQFGQLDPAICQVLDRIAEKETRSSVMAKLVAFDRSQTALKSGTILSRDWNGTMHRVIVVNGGFLWDNTTYDSLSKVAFAITGTRWNGPRFFGLRDAAGNGDQR
ncbi:MAG: DUF2924 domain-containing protein [Xanthobacteraceae bacterium]